MKTIFRVVLVMALLLSVGMLAAQDDMTTITVGLSWNSKDQALVQAWEDYMVAFSQETWGPENNIEFEWIINVADGDPSRQASNIEDLINQGVDVIIARAEDAAAIGASIRAAQQAGIPFVTFDRASAVVPPDAHVGADSYNQAITTAETFAALLEENGVQGQCIELQGALTDINAVNRSQGWQDVEAMTDAYETIVQVPTEWNPELFRSGTANALQANPDANCMFVASDFAFSAVQSALEAAGRWAPQGEDGHMWIAAQDLNPQGLEAMEGGYIDVATTYDAFFHAIEAVNAIAALGTGTEATCGAAIALVQGDEMMAEEEMAEEEMAEEEAEMSEDDMEGMPIGDYVCLVAGRVATPDNVDELENLWSRDYQD